MYRQQRIAYNTQAKWLALRSWDSSFVITVGRVKHKATEAGKVTDLLVR